MSRYPNDARSPDQRPGFFRREIVLPQVHSISARGQRDVGSIVNDYFDTVRARHSDAGDSSPIELIGRQVLASNLN
jgi:hypothetical protein